MIGSTDKHSSQHEVNDSALILALDCGTQSTRAMLFDLNGQMVAKSQVAIEPYVTPQPGWAENDAQYYWESVCSACQQLWEQLTVSKSAIKSVALSCHRGTVINLDDQGEPLRPAIVWLDQRQVLQLPNLGGWQYLFRTIGKYSMVRYFQSQAEINWIQQFQPDIWQQTDKYLFLSGYHSYRLTGRFVDSTASQVGYIPFDFRRQQWCGKHDWKWKALSVRRHMLPELIKPGDKMGVITAQAARETGIPEGLPLIAAGSDKACELLGAGGSTPAVGNVSYGTSATFTVNHDRYLEVVRSIPPYPAARPNAYNLEVMISRGYWMVSWFKREFAQREHDLAKQRGIAPEALLEDLLTSVPPGAMGLILQPYWSPGIREPGPQAKGAIVGFGDVHTRAHIYRAIIEGIAYALREGKERIEKRSGIVLEKLRVSGGGSQSDEAMQITADVFAMPVERPHIYETSGLGAAINGAVGARLYTTYSEAMNRMIHPGRCFNPIQSNIAIYDSLYRDVYKKVYGRLDPLYQSIRKITGYPGKVC